MSCEKDFIICSVDTTNLLSLLLIINFILQVFVIYVWNDWYFLVLNIY